MLASFPTTHRFFSKVRNDSRAKLYHHHLIIIFYPKTLLCGSPRYLRFES